MGAGLILRSRSEYEVEQTRKTTARVVSVGYGMKDPGGFRILFNRRDTVAGRAIGTCLVF